jgi:hypothetical protein
MSKRAVLATDLDTILAEAAAIAEEWDRLDRPAPLPHRLIAKAIALPTAAFALLMASAAFVAMVDSEPALFGLLLLIGAVGFGLEVPTISDEVADWARRRVRALESDLLPEERADWNEAVAEPSAPGMLIGTAFGLPLASLLRAADAVVLLLVPAGVMAGAGVAGVAGVLIALVPTLIAAVRLQRVARASILRTIAPRAALLLIVRQVSVISLRERAAAAKARLDAAEGTLAEIERPTTRRRRG